MDNNQMFVNNMIDCNKNIVVIDLHFKDPICFSFLPEKA